MRAAWYRLTVRVLVVLFLVLLVGPVPGQTPEEVASLERRKAIQGLFHATEESWPTERRIRLKYTFKRVDEKLAADFFPALTHKNKNIRFSTPGDRRSGLITAEFGQFLHKARWKSVTMDMEFTSYSVSRKGDMLAAALIDSKARQGLGSNMGRAMVRIARDRVVGKPMPLVFPQAARRSPMRFGCDFADGVFQCRLSGHTARDAAGNAIETKKLPKWLKKSKVGHVGFIWRGQTQGYSKTL